MTNEEALPAYLRELDKAQRDAVLYTDGPALVIAGAGSGKTRVLVAKLLYLMELGYAPSSLMALTFTNKAAREMRDRMYIYVGRLAYQIPMGTFHSIFARLLRTYRTEIGFQENFTIYDVSDSKSLLKKIIKRMDLDDKTYRPNVVANRISNAKNRLISPQAYQSDRDFFTYDNQLHIPRTGEIYQRYQQELCESNAMDFDDLLFYTNVLLRDHKEVLHEIQSRISFLLIDEYQDTNFAQYMISRQLMQNHGKIFVVGDDAQSIYSFRGANINNILSFQNTFAGTKLFKLEQNYRSTQTIVQAANALIAHNEAQIPKEVYSENEQGSRIELHECLTADDEAVWAADTIKQAIRNGQREYSDCAILYRTNAQSRIIEQAFRSARIPFRIYGGHAFFDYKEIKDVIAYLKLTVNPIDNEAFLRVVNYPKRGLGDVTLNKLRDTAATSGISLYEQTAPERIDEVPVNKSTAQKLLAFHDLIQSFTDKLHNEELPFNELTKSIISGSGVQAEIMSDGTIEGLKSQENFKELLSSIDEYQTKLMESDVTPTLPLYLSEVSLMTDQDTGGENDNVVTLMTVHAAKGLEFDEILILGLEEQLFPSMMCSTAAEIEEERRLLYVAITRARKSCHIGYAMQRYRNGSLEFMRPSRFLRELPPALLEHSNTPGVDPYGTLRGSPHGRKHGDKLPMDFPNAPSDNYLPDSRPRRSFIGKAVHLGTRRADEQLTSHQSIGHLQVGDTVVHAKFGIGIINGLEGDGENARATVQFNNEFGIKKMMLKFAKLQKL